VLLQASLSSKYQAIANPGHWRNYLQQVREVLAASGHVGQKDLQALEGSLLDAWAEATEKSAAANKGKKDLLEHARRLLWVVLALAFLGMIFFVTGAVVIGPGRTM
jgi:hypothetical protein